MKLSFLIKKLHFEQIHFIKSIIVILAVLLIWSLDQKTALADENWVEVEQSPYAMEEPGKDKKIQFLDYRDRRQAWNFRFSFFGANSEIKDFALTTSQLSSSLKSDGVGFELNLSISYNIGALSLGADFGLLSADYEKDVSLLQPKMSLHAYADNLFSNPYFVPYFKIGSSQMKFTNPETSDIIEINSSLALFYSIGGMVSLDWIQKSMAMEAYFNYGLDSTFIVIEFESFPGIEADNISGLPDIKQRNLKFGLQLVF